jgi:hypothetical protein
MKKLSTIILLLSAILLFSSVRTEAKQFKALFLGNSYTYVNNLPQIINDLANSVGDTLIFDSYTPGGYTLDQHNADYVSINKILQGDWDYVILQEQSQLPSFEFYDDYSSISLSQLIRQYNPCARIMFYMTWGRKNGDATNCSVWPPVCTYNGMDSLLHLRYLEMASENKAEVSPVGYVWKYIRQNFPSIELYQPDESHPSYEGSYAAACSFYTSIFRKDPTALTYDYLILPTVAADIRNAAKMIVYDSLSNWDYGDYNPQPDFFSSIGAAVNEIDFWNTSSNADNYLWDFGDGDTSTTKDALHIYTSDGNYVVSLTAYNCDLSQVYQSTDTMHITLCPHNPAILPDTLLLCPNSSDTLWTQMYDSYQWLDNNGLIIPGATNQFFLVTDPGFYSVLTTENGCTEKSPDVYVGNYSSGLIFYWLDTMSTSIHIDSLCAGDTLSLILRTNKPDRGDGIRQWFMDNNFVQGANGDTLNVNASGEYQVKVINPHCTGGFYFESPVFHAEFMQCNIGIEELNRLQQIKVFPNPFNNELEVNMQSNNNSLLTVEILDIFGRIIFSESGVNITKINTSALKEGVYILKIGDGYNFLKKIIVKN